MISSVPSFTSLRSLAALYWQEENWPGALRCYQKLLTINPQDQDARYWMQVMSHSTNVELKN